MYMYNVYTCRWMVSSAFIENINLDGNWIGDGGGRELALALQQRKEGKVTVIHT